MMILHIIKCRICGVPVLEAEMREHTKMHYKTHFPGAFYVAEHLIADAEEETKEEVEGYEVEVEPEPVKRKPRKKPKVTEIEEDDEEDEEPTAHKDVDDLLLD